MKHRHKFVYLYIFFLLIFLLLIFRYFQVQILFQKEDFEKLLKKYSDKGFITLPGWRGIIYTSDGIPMAITVGNYIYYAITDKLGEKGKELYAQSFSKVFNIGPKYLLKILNSKEGYLKIYESTERDLYRSFKQERKKLWKREKKLLREALGKRIVSREKILKICSKGYLPPLLKEACTIQKVLDWSGVNFSNKRVYPHGRFLANTVGFVNKMNEGRAGVELMEDKYLYGGPVRIPYLLGVRGFRLVEKPVYNLFERNLTGDVTLTIDYTIQAILEETKREIVERWKPKKVVLFLMDAYTGEILGLAVYPDFDPNKPFRNWQEFLNSRNPAFMDTFEMGSVIKPFFVGLALYKGRIKPNEHVYIDGGRTYIGKRVVRDAERLPKRYLTPQEVLIHSSNVGTVQIARKLTKEDEEGLINLLGWRKKISDFPGATAGLVPNLNLPANRLYIAFGQGLALTPAHLVSSYAALLTGYAPKPQLIKKVVREDGKVLETFIPKYLNDEPLFDAKTRKWLLETLRLIVVEGTGKKANPYYYIVGGKTGTAQVYDKKLKRYSRKRYVTSFIGFFPYPNPKYVLLVLVDEPKAPRRYLLYGGTVAAPYWAEIVNRVCPYLGIKPSPDEGIFKRK